MVKMQKTKRFRYPKPKVPVVNERAVAVALDAMKQARWLTITPGSYLSAEWFSSVHAVAKSALIQDKKADLQEVLPEVRAECYCCALGACMVAKAHLFDSVPLRSVVHDDQLRADHGTVYKSLKDVFGTFQCELIESAFEMTDMTRSGKIGNARKIQVSDAVYFGRAYVASRDRFMAIMTNIVHNGGVFCPSPAEGEDEA